jgi:hypothetical protein
MPHGEEAMKHVIRVHSVPFAAALACALVAWPAAAQQTAAPRSAEVLAVVKTLFDGMRQADTLKLRSTFVDGARFAVLGAAAAGGAIRFQSVDGWIASMGRAGGTVDERIYDTEVRIDDNIASVWTAYTFYQNGQIRHCGVDSFELLKGPSGWKITQLSDTQKTTGCKEVPPGAGR